jgi:dTDP-glucose 4,6-dehydratase
MFTRILVTGGAGFIGSNFIHYVLAKFPDVTIVNLDLLTYAGSLENLKGLPANARYQFVKGDICDKDIVSGVMQANNIEAVVHFAAETHVDRSISGPGSFINTNINGTFSLLEAARTVWNLDKGSKRSKFPPMRFSVPLGRKTPVFLREHLILPTRLMQHPRQVAITSYGHIIIPMGCQ